MLYFLLVLSTLMATGKSVIFKKIGVDSKSSKHFFRLNGFSFVIATITAIIVSGFNFNNLIHISSYSVIMSVLFAFSIIFTYLTQIKALSLGNASSTMLIYSCGFLIPIFFSAIAYNEKIFVIDIFAIALLLISLFLIINPQKESKLSVKWLLFSFMSMIGSGTTAILQKIHQHSPFAGEFMSLSVWEFIIAGTILAILMLAAPKTSQYQPFSKRELSVGIMNGIFLGSLNLLNLTLAGKLPAIILFPVYNIGSIILTGILCAIIYHEKNTKKEITGFAIGCIAILLIGIF